jgi:hypothetical protein
VKPISVILPQSNGFLEIMRKRSYHLTGSV